MTTGHRHFEDTRDLGLDHRKMVKFNPGISQSLSKVFLSKNMKLELCLYFEKNKKEMITQNIALGNA